MYTGDFYGTSKAALAAIFEKQLIPLLDIGDDWRKANENEP